MRENRCDRLRQTWQINQPTFTTYNCKGETLPTLRQTNTRMAWCRGGTRAGTTGGWTSSSARRRRSQTCRGILRCRRSRQDSVLWRLLDRWSSQWAHMSSCSSRWCRIWKSWKLTGWSGDTQLLLPSLREPPQAEQGLEEIIGDDDCFDVIRFTILHVPKFQCKICVSEWVNWFFFTMVQRLCKWRHRGCRWRLSAIWRTSWGRHQTFRVNNLSPFTFPSCLTSGPWDPPWGDCICPSSHPQPLQS